MVRVGISLDELADGDRRDAELRVPFAPQEAMRGPCFLRVADHWRALHLVRVTAAEPISRLNAALQGRYHIERQLGEGGMATVWLADDLRHERKVALKVLKPELAAVVGAERFLAEIKTTANLQHPHILPLFDSGEADGFLFYVMPYVEGESLRERLDREHQLAVDEAVQIAENVAEALDYAHRRGVVHRDIKPANILLQDGKPVVSDFGIALALGVAGAHRLTETGLSLGTPHYMSPEQATGDMSVGAATDIYSLGCVLYELLVGEPPYTGSTPQAILAKIIMAEPVSATGQRRSVPPNVDAAIRRAVENIPADRFTRAGDFAEALADAGYRHGTTAVGVTAPGPWRRISVGLAVTTAFLALVSAWSLARSRPEPPAVVRSSVTPGEDRRLVTSTGVDIALAPDGSWFVYVGEAPGGSTQLWRRGLEELVEVALPGTEGASAPVVSPDGELVAFVAAGAIRTIALRGGPPATVVPAGGAPAWGTDGMIYFGRDGLTYRVPATGGDPVVFTERVENRVQMLHQPLPDGAGLLLTLVVGTPAQARIGAVGPAGGAVRDLLAGTMGRYSATGHIVYATADGTLMAAPFDPRRLDVTGPSVPLVEGVVVDRDATSQFALSGSGTLLYGTGAGSVSELVWVSRSGVVEAVDPDWVGEFGSPALSPDGTRLAVAVQGPTSMDIWVKQLDRGPSARLTLDGGRNDYPVWTPDGRSVTFTSDRASPSFDLWSRRADGTGEPVLELDEESAVAEALWSPDGEWLIYRTSINVQGRGDILGHRRGQDSAPVPLLASAFTETQPAISPNGRWMAYASNETGQTQIFVVPFPNTSDAKWPVSVVGGSEPAWSRDGRELFYRSVQRGMMAVSVETERGFSIGATSVLFSDVDYLRSIARRQYDVTADGERFILIRPVGAERESQLILVQNFSEELKRRVPK
jgi:eukaryotic-like serine/threonine-protein kinase